MKKRISRLYLLVVFMMFLTVGIFPQKAMANSSIYWPSGSGGNINGSTMSIQIEAGQKFYLGDYIAVDPNVTGYSATGSMVKQIKYTSSNPSVASVKQNTGYVTVKKTGQATITAKYSGTTLKCKLQVVKSGKLKSTTDYKKKNDAAKKLDKIMPSSINYNNAYKIIKAVRTYKNVNIEHLNNRGFIDKIIATNDIGSTYVSGYQLAVPMAGRYVTLDTMLSNYIGYVTPLNIYTDKRFQISSVKASVSKGTLTATLKKAVTAQEIAELQYHGELFGFYNGVSWDDAVAEAGYNLTKKNEAFFAVAVRDLTTGDTYSAIGVTKKGSKTITVKLYHEDSGVIYVRQKLIAGHKYEFYTSLSYRKTIIAN